VNIEARCPGLEDYAKPPDDVGRPVAVGRFWAIGDTPGQMQHNGFPVRYKGGD